MTTTSSAIPVAIGVLVQRVGDHGLVFIAQRPPTAVLGGYWEFPGGKIEPGETPAQCVIREFREEAGLTIRVAGALTQVEHTYPHGRVRVHALLCSLEAGCDLHISPTGRWVAIDQLDRYRFPPANDTILKTLRDQIDTLPRRMSPTSMTVGLKRH